MPAVRTSVNLPPHLRSSAADVTTASAIALVLLCVAPLQKHNIGLKGPMTTPIGKGFRSLNLTLRKV